MNLLLCGAASAQAGGAYGRGNRVPAGDILPAGSVRAMVVDNESQLLGGPKAEGVVGDFKLYNDRAAFIIAGVRSASGINPFGGVIEDAGRLVREDRGAYWVNLMGDAYMVFARAGEDPLMNGRLFIPTSAEVLKDGADGQAVVRVTGRDTEFPMRKEQYGLSSKTLKTRITLDYILRADSTVLETRVSVQVQKGAMDLALGHVFLIGDGADVAAPGPGYAMHNFPDKSAPLLAATSDAVSYAWFTSGRDIRIHSLFDKMVITEIGAVKASEDGRDTFSLFLSVGGGDMASAAEQRFAVQKNTNTGIVAGTCAPASPGALVHVYSTDGAYLNNVACGAQGAFHITLPAGEYLLRAGFFGPDQADPVRVAVAQGAETQAKITVQQPATFISEVADQNGNPIPATISFKPVGAEPARDAAAGAFANKHFHHGMNTYFAAPGKQSIPVRPGAYDVYISRGLEYEYVKKTLDLKPGQTVSESVVLDRVVDTSGYLCGDFHIHAAPSFDSDDTLYDKLLGIAATGLEAPVATDHNMRTDYEPIIEELGLKQFVKSFVGNELTTTRLGHFNAFPLTYMPAQPNRGAIDWIGMDPGDIFAAFRADPSENIVVQVNHPLGADGGYLTFMGYKAETGKAGLADKFSRDFDAMEVLNGGGYQALDSTLPWWFSFLDRGFLVTGVGNSDNHVVFALEVGYPRNYVQTKTDNPEDMDRDAFVAAVHAQQVTVSGGPFVQILANGQGGPGDIVTDTDGQTTLAIRVQAPSWITVDTLKIYSSGGLLKTITLDPATGPELYNSTITVNPARDTWYIAVAEGSSDLFPVFPGKRPYSFTNPVYVDVDGNGAYDPPFEWE